MLGGAYGLCGGALSVPTFGHTENEQSKPRDVACIPFIENLGRACMHSNHTGADPCC